MLIFAPFSQLDLKSVTAHKTNYELYAASFACLMWSKAIVGRAMA
jgi:hypothetical protein